jgi:hypothetical protein
MLLSLMLLLSLMPLLSFMLVDVVGVPRFQIFFSLHVVVIPQLFDVPNRVFLL